MIFAVGITQTETSAECLRARKKPAQASDGARLFLLRRSPPTFDQDMKIEIEREPRGPQEGVAFCVRVFDHPKQFKIDTWSQKRTGIYSMRLDGFGYLKLWQADNLPELLQRLLSVEASDVTRTALQQHRIMQEALERLAEADHPDKPERLPQLAPEPSELEVFEFFEAARQATLDELVPLVTGGQN
jgi:hypothetical protein